MTTSEIERRLTDLLQERAEDAMAQTDTQHKLDALLADDQRHQRTRRLRWAAVGAAAAAVVAGVLVTMAVDGNRTDGTPVAPGPTQSEIVAARFTKGALTGDATGALRMLSADAVLDGYVDLATWGAGIRWVATLRPALVDHTCREVSVTRDAAEVACAYTVHALGSEEAGLGPYPGTYRVSVRGETVVAARDLFNPQETGFGTEVWMPFAQFVAERNVNHARAMYDDLTYPGPRTDARSLRLWERYVSEYLDEGAG